MPWFAAIPLAAKIGLIGATAAAGVGGALAGRKSARTQTQQATTTAMPVELPEYRELGDVLRFDLLNRLRNPAQAPAGILASQLGDINRNFALGEQSLENRLAARGLFGSPVHGAGLTGLEVGRQREFTGATNQFPLLSRALQAEDLERALQFYYSRPIGTSGTSSGQVIFPGSVAGGAIGSAGTMLAYLLGSGVFKKP